MIRSFQVTVLLILAVGLISSANSKCYECNSVSSGGCGSDFNPKTAVEVDCGRSVGVSAVAVSGPGGTQHFTSVKNSTGCLKAVVVDLIGNSNVIRTCYHGDFLNSAPDCASIGPRFGFARTMSCDICSEELCNGSTSLVPFSGLLVVLILKFLV